MIKDKLIDDLKELLTFVPDEECNGTGFYHLSTNEIKGIIGVLERVDGLEQQADDMAEKHAEKDIALNNLYQDYKRLKEALEEISQIGYSDKFGGGWTYTGEYHARCMKIAMETLKKSY